MELVHTLIDEEDFSQEIEEIRRYSVGNQLRAGFFGQEACVQTDVSELPLVKRLSDETAELVEEMETLKKEVDTKVRLMEAQYETRLQHEAEAFYARINNKVKALENYYKEKITVLRNSYQQQFADAVQVIRASYKAHYMKEGGEVLEVMPRDTERMQGLVNELEEKKFQIEFLTEQLREYEERALLESGSEPADDPEKGWLRKENDRLKDDVSALREKTEHIRQALEAKAQSLKDMALYTSQLKVQSDDDRQALQKLAGENEHLKVQLNQEKESRGKQIAKLKQEMEKEIESIENIRQNDRLAAERRREDVRQRERELLAQEAILNPKKAAVEPVVKDKGLNLNNNGLAEELEKLRKAERSHKEQIDRLQEQVEMTNRVWEKKFEILRKNFHAIKDEMFLRQSLQRQAAVLHQAPVSYTMDAPLSHHCRNPEESSLQKTSFSTKTPLPSIGPRETQTVKLKRVDIHLPDTFSTAEGQLLCEEDSDEESTEMLPPPPPPNRPSPSYTTLQSSHNV
ncbi:uncharacterized protein C10orf67, mitochondrial-like isoform X1 [Hoplias malabaricus]|uniref:uncharacterized protein C10orf67, mitochondrial-like isoform X1 n=1 Tax=Hoplias malabaricus TaxID=27720 RepID=UPI0034627FF9